MKKRFLTLLLIPLLICGCKTEKKDEYQYQQQNIQNPRKVGEIGEFNLLTPDNDFSTNTGFTFTWEEANNADYYQLEIANTVDFENDPDEVYVRENNLYLPKFDLSYSLPKKDIFYYWRVTAKNKDHTKECNASGRFFYESVKVDNIPIEIEDEQDWVLHKEGSYADITVDRSNFFGNGKNSLVIKFDKEHTSQGIPKSDGWIVVTKTEDRELYGTVSFYFNFYYSGHDSTVLVRVLDYDGEYWHNQVQISNNAKQTIVMKYEDFQLRTAGTNIFNRVFDWQHIRYFEIVFERTFGDGICIFSDIKAVKYEDYKDMFIEHMDFRRDDMSSWTYENYNFIKNVSEDGSEITLTYNNEHTSENPNGFNGYGFQNINVYKYLAQGGNALKMKVKYTGTGSTAMFYFRVLEEDMDRWQFKVPFTYFTRDAYKELIIPLKAFQRTDYMSGDGAKQFYFIQKFNVGLADNYTPGSISIKDLEVIKIDRETRTVDASGRIEDFNNYDIYTQIYYYWEQSVVNKDEAMKLDTIHKIGGNKNTYCAEFDYKADMEQAVYQLNMDSTAAVGKSAFSLWLKDASKKPADKPAIAYLDENDVTAEMTIQLTMNSGEWYRYTIAKVAKEWTKYTIAFDDFELFNGDDLFDVPNPLSSENIIHMAFGFKYLYYDQQGNHVPTYAIANPVYIDEIYFTNDTTTSIDELDGVIKEDTDHPGRVTIETMEGYTQNDDIFDNWSYGSALDYNLMELSDEVSSEGENHSIKMHYKGSTSVSYARNTPFARTVQARAIVLDIKGDSKATVYVNLNWRKGTSLLKMRYCYNLPTTPNRLKNISSEWTRYTLGFSLFRDVGGTNNSLLATDARDIESISFGIVNGDNSASDIYVDNIRFLVNADYEVNTAVLIG